MESLGNWGETPALRLGVSPLEMPDVVHSRKQIHGSFMPSPQLQKLPIINSVHSPAVDGHLVHHL